MRNPRELLYVNINHQHFDDDTQLKQSAHLSETDNLIKEIKAYACDKRTSTQH